MQYHNRWPDRVRRSSARAGIVAALVASLLGLAACGGAGDWYYHWSCNGDSECLATNPTGQPSGDLDEGPEQVNCTQLMDFAARFWGPAATNSCDQSPTAGGDGNGAYTLVYDANGATGGTVPVDPNHYDQGNLVTVLGNTGNLARTVHTFSSWNSKADGTGTDWSQGQQFVMDASNATLYAKWSP